MKQSFPNSMASEEDRTESQQAAIRALIPNSFSTNNQSQDWQALPRMTQVITVLGYAFCRNELEAAIS